MPPSGVLLIEDETTLRLLPPLRAAWALQGSQAEVPISGYNAQRVLFGAVNPRTGHRIVLRRHRARQEDFCAFLEELRRRYHARPIWLLLDRAPCHVGKKSLQLAGRLEITLLWLPKQCPELNAMDHLWRSLKGELAANRQFPTIDLLAEHAEAWIHSLSPTQTLCKAGLLSPNCWLKF